MRREGSPSQAASQWEQEREEALVNMEGVGIGYEVKGLRSETLFSRKIGKELKM